MAGDRPASLIGRALESLRDADRRALRGAVAQAQERVTQRYVLAAQERGVIPVPPARAAGTGDDTPGLLR